MTVPKPLLERLVVAKYLVKQAREVLASSAPFSAGVAVGQLQDATELFLRVLAEHFHAQLRERVAFDQLVEAIADVIPAPLTHRTSLNQLNKARVNFKHFALEPRREDAEKLLHDIESFFPETMKSVLSVDYATLSLNCLLQHQRTENWLRDAEHRIDAGDPQGAIDAAAIAFAVFRRYLGIVVERVKLDRFGRHRDSDLRDLIDAIQDEFHDIHSQLDLMLAGINLSQYRLFLTFAPTVAFFQAGTYSLSGRRRDVAEPSKDQAAICLSFVVDSALALKKSHIPRRHHSWRSAATCKVEVISEDQIVVYPQPSPEVLRTALAGEILPALNAQEVEGFVAIVHDGELAYIPKKAVRELSAL